jgi:hypothetical protein
MMDVRTAQKSEVNHMSKAGPKGCGCVARGARLLNASRLVATCAVAIQIVAADSAIAQSLGRSPTTMNARLNFRHFEHLPEKQRLAEAQAEAERLFPAGTRIEVFEENLTKSGAKCSRGTDSIGPYVLCLYEMQGLSLVSTTWTVTARPDAPGKLVEDVKVTRYLTGL